MSRPVLRPIFLPLFLAAALLSTTSHSPGGPLDGYPLLLSCHEPSVIRGMEATISAPSELLENIDWLASTDAIFVLNAFTLSPKWNSKIDHMVGVAWDGKPVTISDALRKDPRFVKRTAWANNSKLLHDHDTDAVKFLSERAKKKGVTFFVRFRMNDHYFQTRREKDSRHQGYFWIEHPTMTKNKQRFDWNHVPVRKYYLDLMREILTMHPVIEGFEMDFMRSPEFFAGDDDATFAPVMTEFVREARNLVETINSDSGREVVLGACVPTTVADAMKTGLDVKTWAKEGLVDYLVPKRWTAYGCETRPDLDLYRKEVGGEVKIFGHYNDYKESPRYAEAAAMSAVIQTEGADGVHLFNVWNDVIGLTPEKKKRLLGRLNVLKRDAWKGKNKYYGYGLNEVGKYGLTAKSELPAFIRKGNTIRYEQTIGNDFKRFTPVDIEYVLTIPSKSKAGFRISINGTDLAEDRSEERKGGLKQVVYRLEENVLRSGIRANTISMSPSEDVEIREMALRFDLKRSS